MMTAHMESGLPPLGLNRDRGPSYWLKSARGHLVNDGPFTRAFSTGGSDASRIGSTGLTVVSNSPYHALVGIGLTYCPHPQS